MKKLKQEADFKKNHKLSLWFVVIVVLFSLAAILKIVVANKLVTASDQIAKLEKKSQVLEEQNGLLGYGLAKLQSVSVQQGLAKNAGFEPVNKNLIYLQKQNNIALLTHD